MPRARPIPRRVRTAGGRGTSFSSTPLPCSPRSRATTWTRRSGRGRRVRSERALHSSGASISTPTRGSTTRAPLTSASCTRGAHGRAGEYSWGVLVRRGPARRTPADEPNLLLSRERGGHLPQLEILTDDVKVQHGSTPPVDNGVRLLRRAAWGADARSMPCTPSPASWWGFEGSRCGRTGAIPPAHLPSPPANRRATR